MENGTPPQDEGDNLPYSSSKPEKNIDDDNIKHKVRVPSHGRDTVGNLVDDVLEYPKALLFPSEGPFDAYRGKPAINKLKIFLFKTFPILDWLFCNYKLDYLKGDIIGGLSIASLAIPQDIAYARLAHLPPVNGLYSSFVPPLIYSALGTSRHLAIGPVAVLSLLLGEMLRRNLDPVNDSTQIETRDDPNHTHYYAVAITTTFFVGIIQLGMGIFRLGFIIDFLSHSVIVGFMGGAVVTIGFQQFIALFGYDCKTCTYSTNLKFTEKTDVISVTRSLIEFHDRFNYRTFLLGFFFLCYLMGARQLSKKYSKLFYLGTTGPMVATILSTVFMTVSHLGDEYKHGNNVIVRVPKFKSSINPLSISLISQTLGDTKLTFVAFKTAIVCAFIALTEACAIGRSFAAMKGYQTDGNKEMIACGSMNLGGSMTSCFIATGSLSRSAVNFRAGSNTPVTNLIMSSTILLTLLALTPLFANMPTCILSVIIISAVIGLIDFPAACQIWKTDKWDFMAMSGAFFGTIFVDVETGLIVAVSLSLFKLLLQVSRPRTALLGQLSGTTVYRNIDNYPEAMQHPGILVARLDASLYFVNSNYFRERLLGYVGQATEKGSGTPVRYLIVEMGPVMEVDCSAIHAFSELHRNLKHKGVQLVLANTNQAVLNKMASAGFLEKLEEQWLFLSVYEAVKMCTILL